MLTWGWSADPNLAGGRERRGEAGEEGNPRRHATGTGWERRGSSAALLKRRRRRRRRRRPAQSRGAEETDRERGGSGGVLPASSVLRFCAFKGLFGVLHGG